MVTIRSKIYEYHTGLKWTEAKKGVLSSTDKPDIQVATPPEFRGHPGCWTPEHLFVSSIQTCIMTTFLAITDKRELKINSYQSEVTGKVQMVDNVFRFSEVKVFPKIVIPSEIESNEISKAIARAEEKCLVSNSLVTKVMVEPIIEVQN